MGDIDQALARAYARRSSIEPAGTPPPPHFNLEAPAPPAGASTSLSVPLEWPQTVKALEREHGDRFDRLADALVMARDRRQLKVLLFTSCHRAEGRTTLVLTLARALARRPGRTLIVDADLAGPMLARSLGLRPRLGLDDVIDDGASTADAVLEAADDHLSVLPLRGPVAHPRDFLSGPAWATTFARLRRDFDLVLVDGGPLFVGLSTPGLPRSIDAAILVRNKALTGPKAVRKARQILEGGGIPLLGLAETFV
jgi:Mrp family chromosome partitioning ATPase